MSVTDLAKALHVTTAAVYLWRKRGAPLDSAEVLRAWVSANIQRRGGAVKARRRMGGPQEKPAKKADGEAKGPEAAPAPKPPPKPKPSKPPPDGSYLDGLLRRCEVAEETAHDTLMSALRAQSPAAGQLAAVHRDTARNLLAVRTEILDAATAEGRLIPEDAVRKMIVDHDANLSSRLRSMPKTLAHLLRPDEPTTAEKILVDWLNHLLKEKSA